MSPVLPSGAQRELRIRRQGDEETPRRAQHGGSGLAIRTHDAEQSVQPERERREAVRVSRLQSDDGAAAGDHHEADLVLA